MGDAISKFFNPPKEVGDTTEKKSFDGTVIVTNTQSGELVQVKDFKQTGKNYSCTMD
jgi:hypothetical protein